MAIRVRMCDRIDSSKDQSPVHVPGNWKTDTYLLVLGLRGCLLQPRLLLFGKGAVHTGLRHLGVPLPVRMSVG